jgi:hypothetical protein
MWKLIASLLCLGAVAGPVTVALAAADDGLTPVPATAADQLALRLESERLAARADAAKRDAAAEHRRERRDEDVRVPAALEAIAACESGGDPHAVGGGGTYRGKYQFSGQTWASVGGKGDPADAPEAEQDRRAAMLYAREGAGHWPVCGRS